MAGSEHGMLARDGFPRAAVSGIDLVRDGGDQWLVLEDNLRVPSGIGYAITSLRLVRSVLPELEPPAGVVPVEGVPELLHKTLLAAMPPKAGPDGTIALLTAGPVDSAWYEHQLLAESMALVVPGELAVIDARSTVSARSRPAPAGRDLPAAGRGNPGGRDRLRWPAAVRPAAGGHAGRHGERVNCDHRGE